jgi:hypothetical protein
MMATALAPLPPPQNLPVTTPVKVSPGQALSQIQTGSIFSDRSLTLTYIILAFGLLALVLLYLMARHERDGLSELRQFELRIFTITILVFGSLLVAAAGFGSDQLTPLIGFFGTIAGYILGRGDRPNDTPQKRKEPNEGS